jgi:hypothetical protein
VCLSFVPTETARTSSESRLKGRCGGYLRHDALYAAREVLVAESTCGKCGGHLFELTANEPYDARFKVAFIQCRNCGTPAGVQDYYNLGQLLKEQDKRLKQLEARLSGVQSALDGIVRALQRR